MDHRFIMTTRGVEDGDTNFIYNSFLKSFRLSPVNDGIANSKFFSSLHDKLEDYLKSPDIKVFIAGPPDDKDTIYGWVLGSPNKLVYVYVKQTRRRLTVATKLMQKLYGNDPQGDIQYIFPTSTGLIFLKYLEDNVFPNVRFNQGL